MDFYEIKEAIKQPEYDFLRTNQRLGDNIILLTLGGSHAYGTETPSSDLDIRGIALNSRSDILGFSSFEQFTNEDTDTIIYGFRKIIGLLSNCNPNVIEMLGCKPEHYLIMTNIGKELIDNREIFLSKQAINSFGGYANQQLYRLNQKAATHLSQADMERHILKTLQFIQASLAGKYAEHPNNSLRLYTDKAVNPEMDSEIFMDINLSHYPLRDYCGIWSELQTTVKQYNKTGCRNEKAAEHGKLGKHMMHLCRLYLMCFDILERREISTYREKEHDFLMSVRNGVFLDENEQPKPEFFDIVADYEKRLEYDKENTDLPARPDMKKIEDFAISVAERTLSGDVYRTIPEMSVHNSEIDDDIDVGGGDRDDR